MKFTAIQPNGKHFIVIQDPAIFGAPLRLGRTLQSGQMGRGIQDPPPAREKVSAGRGAVPRAHPVNGFAVQIHHVHLIALAEGLTGRIFGGLKNQPRPVKGKIGLGVFAACGQLFDVAQMWFALAGSRRFVGPGRGRYSQDQKRQRQDAHAQ